MTAKTEQFEVADAKLIRSVIQRVATGPELSKNISYSEARATMHALLDGSADPVQAGIFLIGLRMKRETDDEMKGVLDACRDRSATERLDLADLLDVSDPYNGYNRTLPASFFVLPVLAACGLPAYSHGVESMGPKFGVTHHTIIRALDGEPRRDLRSICDDLSDQSIGWAYADQQIFCPPLHALTDLRTRIVKRPVLTTVEVLCGPLKSTGKTHFMTGFVHKPYPPIYTMLARHTGFQSALLVRGTEGGIIPSFRQRARVVHYQGLDYPAALDIEVDFEPDELDLRRDFRAADIPANMKPASRGPSEHAADRIGLKWDIDEYSKACANAGVDALNGQTGAAMDAVVFGAALALWHTSRAKSLADGARQARASIHSGAALERLEAGIRKSVV